MPARLDRRTLIRRAAAAGLVLSVGGAFVAREFIADDAPGSAVHGLLDDRRAEVGLPMPEFVLPSLAGQPIRSSDFRGKTLVLNFWASWCPPCRAEMPDLQALWDERQSRDDLVVLGVDFLAQDTTEAATAFVQEFALTFPVVTDTPTGDVALRYGVRGLPATFFIDRAGILRRISFGPVFGDLLPEGVAAADAAL
ncbi:MAG: TlpA disulfide reductase family protein [Chloroflexi bacterium]|nr:TlpA disulfide reductase family protein [Chloroflexota bacterium]MDA1147812.1 TlpA disulfide reductase family protein [Chloroflexota bacterium]